MSIRTIQAPGVEIKEIDKSAYSPSMTGTRCFVAGYASKGEPYQPMEFTSKSAWQSYYGDPTNEAERYFYNACSEVINQNGVLYTARIPYDNKSYGKMVGYKFKVGQVPKHITSAGEYLKTSEVKKWVDHDKDFETAALMYTFGNKFYREIDGEEENGFEFDHELETFYKKALEVHNDMTKRGEIDNVRWSVQYYKLNLSASQELSARFLTKPQAQEYLKTFDGMSRSGLYRYINDEKCIISDDGDWLVQPLFYNYDHIATLSTGEEISTLSDAEQIWEKLSSEEDTVIHGYKKDIPCTTNIPFEVSEDTILSDGFDDEYIFNTTVSDLYTQLNLSDKEYWDEDYKATRTIGQLYNEELVEMAKANSLSGLIKKTADQKDVVKINNWKEMIEIFKDEGGITFKDIIEKYKAVTKERISQDVPYYQLNDADHNIDEFLEIESTQNPIEMELKDIDSYRTQEERVPAQTFWVVDKTCATLNSVMEDSRKGEKRQLIGIFPVITTAANALYAQSMIEVDDDDVVDYETVTDVFTKPDSKCEINTLLSSDITTQFSNKNRKPGDALIDTVSRDANGYFLPIQMNPEGSGFDTEHFKKIGVVVYKAYLDASEGNKVSVTPVESFIGTLDRNAKNPNTNVSLFIDNIVNTQSQYIYFFSNCFVNATQKKNYNDSDLFIMKPGPTGMLGFYEEQTAKTISLPSLYAGIDKCFKNVEDINERDIDIIPDAGLANIAQYIKSVYGSEGAYEYDLGATDEGGNSLINKWKVNSAADVNAWKTVEFKFDNFCKNVRKDCMFIADGPRPMVLNGQKKIVRPSKPDNTIDANILPYVKYVTGLNTNYGAGYLDWFQVTDEFTGDEFWCPPSIKAMGVYINTDLNFNYWDAPAGLNRGVLQALDCAFSPTIKQAGSIYGKNWNYAINYPQDGIVLEGQKTFQVKPSAFDRVNVRRLFLRLERQTYKVARYFVYEGNTAYTRQRLVDMLNPIFQSAKVGGGIYDFKIICDESNNTPNVIDNNELRVKIGIKPVKSAEFILIDFIALSTGGSFSEM